MVSTYSIFSAIVFYNLSLVLVFLLRRKTRFLARYSTSALLFITVLGLVRLFTPIDLKPAVVIPSTTILPAVQNALLFNIPVLNISIGLVLLIIWGGGTVGFILRDIVIELRSYRIRRKYSVVEDKRIEKLAAGFSSEYKVIISPDVKSPYVAGIFRPVIYLPDIELTDDDLRFILRHEIQHILSHDGLKKLLFLAIEALFWWNPLAHITMSEIDAILELQCDAKITAGSDDKAVLEYMRTLLYVMKLISSAEKCTSSCAIHFAGDQAIIKQRFEVMLNRDKKRTKATGKLLCSIFVAVFLMSYMIIIQPRFEPSANDLGGVIDINPSNSSILYDDGSYYLYVNGVKLGALDEGELKGEPYCGLEIIGGNVN